MIASPSAMSGRGRIAPRSTDQLAGQSNRGNSAVLGCVDRRLDELAAVPDQIHPVSAAGRQAAGPARLPRRRQRRQQVQLAELRLQQHFGHEAGGGHRRIDHHGRLVLSTSNWNLLIAHHVLHARLADQLREDPVRAVAVQQAGEDPDFPAPRPVSAEVGLVRHGHVAIAAQVHRSLRRGIQFRLLERIEHLSGMDGVNVHEVPVVIVRPIQVIGPFLQLAELSDRQRHEP